MLFCFVLGTPLGGSRAQRLKSPTRFLLLLLALTTLGRTVAWGQVCATPGKDGSPAALSGIVNTYFPGSGTANNGSTSISIAASPGATGTAITAGDLLLVIQMQGADINSTDGSAYGAGTTTGAGNLGGASFTAGSYEYVVATNGLTAASSGTITINKALVNSYSTAPATTTSGRRSFQVVRIPQYGNVTMSGQVSALAWNGSIGGVLAMDVAGTLTLAGQTLNAAGLGFRGGAGFKNNGNTTTASLSATSYRTLSSLPVNGTKGEGTAGTPRYTSVSTSARVDNATALPSAFSGVTDGYPNGDNGRGAPGNAGGGGTDASPTDNGLNAGGAGGGNAGAGGLGGAPRNGSGTPTTGASQALGGVAFAATPSRLVMGGGGGAGTNNNGDGDVNDTGYFSSGAPGGGIIIVRTGSLNGPGTANASGNGGYLLTGTNTNATFNTPAIRTNDATGGGGAGGTVLVTARNTTSLSGLTVIATGGTGSRNSNPNDVAHGPGGGGSGGIVFANGGLASVSVTGGAAGTTTSTAGTSTFGATPGAGGTSTTGINAAIANSAAGADCIADVSTSLTATNSVNVGQTVTVRATFSNAGPLDAVGTVRTVMLPAGATVTSATGGTITVNSGVTTVTYPAATLKSGEAATFTINYIATAATANTTVTVTSAISTNTTEGTLTANNSALASTTVSTIGAAGTPAPCATPGKDGSPTLSVNPNTYYPGTASAAAGAISITVGAGTRGSTTVAASTISAGDLLLVMQMQGAEINTSNNDSYGDGVAGGGASGNLANANFTAGLYEYVVATNATPIDVTAGGIITLASPLRNSYISAATTTTIGQRRFQVVRVPQYASLTLSGTITATPWNGSIGGIIAIDVAGQTNFSNSTIDVSARGFRGGGGRVQTPGNFRTLDYVSATNATADLNAQKGEGTAGTPRFVNVPTTPTDAATNVTTDLGVSTIGYPSGSAARGAPGNAGGGANDNGNNSGGGGGANGGSGGRGGNSYLDNNAIGGEPGASFSVASSSRLVMGGGGGAGTNDTKSGTPINGAASSGAPGGGIILLRTGTIVGSGTISANGGNANNTLADDGSGGGGAGGSILLTAKNPSGLANLTLNARGGTGGTNTGSASGTTPAHGPGGGGGGGIILTNGNVAATATAGTNGTTVGANPAYGSTAGTAGVTSTNISTNIAGSAAGADCAADVTVSLAGPTTLNAGQPTGNFTATFTNEGPSLATNVTRTITLPAGASLTQDQKDAITRAYLNATFPSATSINFGNLSSLASDASNVVTFAFTAPTTTGASNLTGNTGPGTNGTSEGINFAPDQSVLALNTVTTADVQAAITASTNAAGTTGMFNVTFSNIGAQTADGVVRTVQLPAGLRGPGISGTNPDNSPNNGVTVTNGYYNANTGLVVYSPSPTTLAVGTSAALTSTISYTLASSLTPVAATANVSTTTNEAGLRDNNTATAVMPATFDLATTLTGPTTTTAGSPTVLYVTTSNNGPNSAPVATQTVVIPSATALTNVYITNGGTYVYNTTDKAGTVTFPNVNNLPSGASVTNSISFTVPVNDSSPTNSTAPSATVVLMTGETNSANNTAYLNGSTTSTAIAVLGSTTTANNAISKANEQTTIVANATVVDAGAVVTYTVTAKDAGAAGATSVSNVVTKVQLLPNLTTTTLRVGTNPVVTTLLNGNIEYVTTNGTSTYNPTTGVLTYYTIVNQPSGATTTYDALAVTVPANVGNDGQLLATASVSTDNIDPVPSDNTSSVAVKVKTTADLTTTITGPTATTAGQKVSYTATFSNRGLGTASSVVETVQLPIGLSNVNVVVQDASGNVINNAYNATTGIVTLPTIPSDASGTTQVYGISFAAPGQAFVVSSNISSGTSDNVVTNNASAVSTTVSPTADVAIYVSGPATAVAGNAVTYAVTATNNGPNVANAVTPTLQLPVGLTGAGPIGTNPDNSSNNGVTVTGGGYYNASTGLVTFPAASLVSSDSRVGLVTFTMPSSPNNGFVAGAAAYSFGGPTPSVDVVASNNTAGIVTSIAPATPELADLVTIIMAPTSPTIAAGTSISYGLSFTNRSTTTPAIKVMPVAYLPAGLVGVVVTNGSGAVVSGANYNSTTGQVTFPTIDSQAAGNTTSYTISLNAPANDVVISASAVSSNTSDPDPSNNIISNTLTITPSFDVVTKLTGPTSATPGSTNTYTVTTTNNGPSTSPTTTNTVQTVTVPAGSVVSGLPTGATYSNGVITFAPINGQATGANGAVSNTFTVQMPAAGSLAIQANVTLNGESNINNNQDNLTTQPFNPAPVALNVWNTLRSARGNNSNTGAGLPISNLLATDTNSNGTPNTNTLTYTAVAVPDPAQGVLYSNNIQVFSGQTVNPSGLSFVPAAGYVGNATFAYTATDGGNAVSNVALYTIPVALDLTALYTVYNNSKPGSAYTIGTVLAQVVDPNAAVYNNSGVIYDNTTGVMQAGASNGLLTTGTNAVLATGSTLPMGISLDPATGRIYVSGPLANSNSPQTYNLSVTTTDGNGGITTQNVRFTIGANPLPVTLVAFTAEAVQNRDAQLTWTTASEANNDHFEVERSLDGTTFTKLDQVAGQGTTSLRTAYAFTDVNVARQANGPVYYRLKQVDMDGTSTYSPVRTVSFAKAAVLSLSLYPNPAQTTTTLELSQLPTTTSVQVLVIDATGRTVLSTTLGGGMPQLLDVRNFATGTYQVVVSGTQPDGTPLRKVFRLTKD